MHDMFQPLSTEMLKLGYEQDAMLFGYPMEFYHPKARVAIELYRKKYPSSNRDSCFRAHGIIPRRYPVKFALGDTTGFLSRAKYLVEKYG